MASVYGHRREEYNNKCTIVRIPRLLLVLELETNTNSVY